MATVVRDEDGIRIVTLNRPERRNALDAATTAEVGEAFATAEHDDDVRVLILTGTGDRAFCAGADLRAFRDAPPTPAQRQGPGTEIFTERRFAKPVIAAVNGAAMGGGFGFVLACDLVVAAAHATFGLPEVQRGLVGAGAVSKASLRLPPALALELSLVGDPIDAERAYALGIVNRVVPSGTELDEAMGMARRIAANGPLAVRLTKEIVYEARHLVADLDMARLRAIAAPAIGSEDAKEGAAAFAEKRPPVFRGR